MIVSWSNEWQNQDAEGKLAAKSEKLSGKSGIK
jgi:hypothetical protein